MAILLIFPAVEIVIFAVAQFVLCLIHARRKSYRPTFGIFSAYLIAFLVLAVAIYQFLLPITSVPTATDPNALSGATIAALSFAVAQVFCWSIYQYVGVGAMVPRDPPATTRGTTAVEEPDTLISAGSNTRNKRRPSPFDPQGPEADFLHSAGYEPQLQRRMPRLTAIAATFSIICVLLNGTGWLGLATSPVNGGAGFSWIIGVAMVAAFANPISRLVSAFPAAGGPFYWSSVLGNRFFGFLTGWMHCIGLIALTATTNLMSVASLPSLNLVISTGDFDPLFAVAGMTLIQVIILMLGSARTASVVNWLSAAMVLITIGLIVALLIFAPSHDFGRLLSFISPSDEKTQAVQSTNLPLWFVLSLGLPVLTFASFAAPAHLAEEIAGSNHSVSQGILLGTVGAAIIGGVLVCVLIIAMPSLPTSPTWGQGQSVMTDVMPSDVAAFFRGSIFVAGFVSGLVAMAATSRAIFAFARDGGLPLSRLLSRADRFGVPVLATFATAVLALIYVWLGTVLGLIGWTMGAMIVMIFLSYGIPIWLGAFAIGTRRWPTETPRFVFRFFAIVCAIAIVPIVLLVTLPPFDGGPWVILGVILAGLFAWFLFGNRNFRQPLKTASFAA